MYVFSVLFVLAFCLVCGHFITKCSKTEQNPIIKERIVRDSIKSTDTIINNIIHERIKIKTKLDTLNKIIYVPRQVIVKDSVLCDSLYSLAIVQKKMISNDSLLIGKLNVNIKSYKRLDTLHVIKYDSLALEFDKVKRKYYVKGFKHGFVTGNVTGFGSSVLLRK
jgi:hypothetical protein